MAKGKLPIVTVTLDKIVGGGQAMATEENGRKLFVWGGLPDETVKVQLTKKKSNMAEGVVVEVIKPSPSRIEPRDIDSYLSTSPWQIMDFESEQHYKAALIEEAFELHNIVLPNPITVYSDGKTYGYRNKMEFSWWWDKSKDRLDLAFFRRGSHGKIPVEDSGLANPAINKGAQALRDALRLKTDLYASDLKTALVRCDQQGNSVVQLYVKRLDFPQLDETELSILEKNGVVGFEMIFSDPKSPASVITKRIQNWGDVNLKDKILKIAFGYVAEGFFQVNLPVYEKTLSVMDGWIDKDKPAVDLYSGVGTIGLTIGGESVTMVESNPEAVYEMNNNIEKLGKEKTVKAIEAPSEKALSFIKTNSILIVDPPRAGLHQNVIEEVLIKKPKKILYLSCNPVTQARDIAKLLNAYEIKYHEGFNFFPRTPHIEHLVVLVSKR